MIKVISSSIPKIEEKHFDYSVHRLNVNSDAEIQFVLNYERIPKESTHETRSSGETSIIHTWTWWEVVITS